MVLLGQHAVGGADLREGAAAVEAERGVIIGFSALQFPSLTGRRSGVSFIARRRSNEKTLVFWRDHRFWRRQQLRRFEQAAKIFFAGDLQRAFFGGEAGHGFVFHFKPFEPDDADVLRALLPDLALAQFHGRRLTNRARRRPRDGWGKNLPLLILSGEAAVNGRLLLLGSGRFLGGGFFRGGLLRFGFGGHRFLFLLRVDSPSA